MLNKFNQILCFVVACSITTLVHASALEQFKSFVSGTRAARGEFTQRMVKKDGESGNLKLSNASDGSFQFTRPGKFIWIYK